MKTRPKISKNYPVSIAFASFIFWQLIFFFYVAGD
jgi:hypothetical protein